MTTKTIGVVDLFCGVGGLTNGLQQAGLKVVAGFDLDASCEYAYSHNNNTRFIEKSVEDISGKEIKSLLRGFDIKVIVGCAPCQPFSQHQKDKKHRNHHKDWGLLYQFSRIVKEVKPHIVSMENVPELEREAVFKDFVNTLKDIGYYVSYRVVDAADYGVPQRRRRLVLLASRIKQIALKPPTHITPITVRQAIGFLPSIDCGEKNPDDFLHVSSKLSAKNLERIRHSIPGGSWKDWPDSLRLECHKKKTGESYGSVYGRMRWDDVSPTITTQFTNYGTGRFGHPEQDRALSLREGAILQSFPRTYAFVESEKDMAIRNVSKHIGNAVPPRLGQVIGESIIDNCRKRKYTKRVSC